MFSGEPSGTPTALMDGEGDRNEAGGGERTTGVGGINVIIEGDRESNGNLGDGLR